MIVLYNPQSSPNKKPVLPMSLLAVGALLEGKHDYEIVDGNLVQDGQDTLARVIDSRGADILGVTVMPGPQLVDALPIARNLKARFPQLRIVWGGYFPTMHPQTILESGVVDYVLRGHNEAGFRGLVSSIREGHSPRDLPGLGYRDETGHVRLNPMGAVPDVDQLPDFPYARVDVERYVRATFMGTRTISHHASYGCPFRCNFCAVVNMVDGRYSAQSAAHVARVVERLVREHRANAVEFYDNNFFVGESRVAEFCERIRHLGIGWWGYGRIDTMLKFSDRTWSLLRDSGLKMVFMGAEAGSDEVLRRMNKGGSQTTDQALEIAARMQRFGIVPEMSFVLGNPPDPEEDVTRTLEFVRRVKAVNRATEIVLYLYSPVPVAGDMLSAAAASGFEFPRTLDDWARADWVDFAQHRSADLPWLTDAVKRRLRNFQRVLHAAYPTTTDPRLTGTRRALLRLLGGWRYALRFYQFPLELRLLDRIAPYQRPEVSGF
jgi:anaerobic magnesium-protoporphyrin IX monomethyl ester cyclase